MSNHRSIEARAYRAMYDTAEWKALRSWQLQREPLCRCCRKAGRVTAASVVDHVLEHRGDSHKFFDPVNLQSLCKPCHDGPKQSLERTGHARGCDASGQPLDATSHWHTPPRGGQILPASELPAADGDSREKNLEISGQSGEESATLPTTTTTEVLTP